MMPFMSGIDFLDSLQALVNDPSLKSIGKVPAVIVVTSVAAPINLRADERGTPAEARTMLEKAVAHYKAVGRK